MGHSYSRANVKLNVNEADKMVIQAISGLDTLDKDITYSSARVRFVDISTGFSFSYLLHIYIYNKILIHFNLVHANLLSAYYLVTVVDLDTSFTGSFS